MGGGDSIYSLSWKGRGPLWSEHAEVYSNSLNKPINSHNEKTVNHG